MRTSPPLLFSLIPITAVAALCLAPASLLAQEQLPYVVRGDQPPDNSPQPDYTTDHYTAVVVSSLDGKPVSRVLVTSADRRFAAMTDYEGRISFDYRRIVQSTTDPRKPIPGLFGFGLYGGPQTMPIQFQVRKPGYVSNMVVLYLPAIPSDTPRQPLQLKIVPAGVITGHVDPDNGDPHPTLQVQLYRKSIQNGSATWNTAAGTGISASGTFRFPDLQPGDYKLGTAAWTPPAPQRPAPDSVSGLKPSFYPDAGTLDSAGLIHVGPAETVTARLVPHAATFYHVTIPIAGADTAAGASVLLLSDSTGLNINFNSQDHALEGFLPTGSYTADVITFTRNPPAPPAQPGAPALVRLVPNRNQNSTAIAHFEVGSGPVHGAPVTPSPTSDIPIYVHREFTNPNPSNSNSQVFSRQGFSGQGSGQNERMPAVSVFLQPLAPNRGSNGSLAPVLPGDPDDSLKLQNVTEGVYHVNVQSTQGGYVASATCGTTDLLRDPLTVGASGSASPIVVTLRDDSASLSGTILQNSAAPTQLPTDGGPANPILVMGIPLDRPETNPLVSGVMINPSMQQGSFRMGSVPPGRYLFVAYASQQIFQELEYHNPEVLRDLMTKGTPVTLSAGEKTDIQVPLLPTSSESGEGN
jgi:hypothetical protein